jgi:hypothetical protein
MALSLRTTLEDNAPGLVIELPAEVIEQLGAGKRPAVKATFNGSYEYHTRVAVYGGKYYLGLRKDVREAAMLAPGETVDLTLELDEEPREVVLPDDLAAGLRTDPEEYVEWVTSAKRAETRQRRLAEVPSLLKRGVRTPV